MNDKRILVVDDETDLLEMVKSIFTRAGFTQVLTASSGEAALKMCEEQEPDMMILDVMMPGMDGFAALKELRKTSKIPVLMLTARGEAEDKFVGFENGADDYLLKPALLSALVTSFVRAMTTVSAIIFLVTADTRVATAYILNRVEDGEYGVAIAYGSILIIVMMAIILFFDWIVGDTRISRSKAKKMN